MNSKVKLILNEFKGKRVGVFVDDGNVFHLQREVGFKIDWEKFKKFLATNFDIWCLRYYRGIYPIEWEIEKEVLRKHQNFGDKLISFGYEIVTRKIKKIYKNKEKSIFEYKCDFDAEIGFDVGKTFKNYDLVIVVSGDSDFAFLEKELKKFGKSFLTFCFRVRAPWELTVLKHIFFEDIRDLISWNTKNRPQGPVKNTVVSVPYRKGAVK